VKQPDLVEDLSDPAAVAYRGQKLGVADLVPTAVSGQQHDQALVDPLDQLVRPATSLSEGVGSTASV
jgi:hypothetical protein